MTFHEEVLKELKEYISRERFLEYRNTEPAFRIFTEEVEKVINNEDYNEFFIWLRVATVKKTGMDHLRTSKVEAYISYILSVINKARKKADV